MLTYADVCRYYTRDDKSMEYGWRLMDPNMAHRDAIHKLLWYSVYLLCWYKSTDTDYAATAGTRSLRRRLSACAVSRSILSTGELRR